VEQGLVFSFSVVQQNSFPLITYVQPVAVFGSTYFFTFEAVTHKMSGSEGYLKELLEPEG
jgi:hypothetical protein